MKFFRRYWLYALVATLPLERIPSLDVALGSRSITLRLSLIIALLAVLFLIHTVRIKLSPRVPEFWMLAYVAVMALSVGVAQEKGRALLVVGSTTLLIALALVISRQLKHFSLNRIFQVLTVVTVIVCIFGLFQFIGDSAGLGTNVTGLKSIYTKSVFGFPRIQATGLEPLYFANFLLIPLILTAALLYTKLIRWQVYLPVLFLYTLTLALTLSRGGFAAAAAAFGVMVVCGAFHGSFKRLLAILAVCVLAAATSLAMISASGSASHSSVNVVQTYVKQSTKITSNAGSPDNDRVTNRRLALAAFKEHPLLGLGIGNFGAYAKSHEPNYAHSKDQIIVNNEYLEVLAETGILGSLALLGVVVTLGLKILTSRALYSGRSRGVWILAFASIGVGFIVQYYAFSTLYLIQLWTAVGLLLGLLAFPQDDATEKTQP